MRRVGAERIKQLALEAVEEAAAAALRAPVERSRALAVALAWLLHFGRPSSPPPRWPFTHFWDALAVERDHDRQVSVTAAANAIYLALGEKRDLDQIAIFREAEGRRAENGR